MSKSYEWTFFQKGHADAQQAHKKMLNIMNQRNANQTHNELPHFTCQNGYYQEYHK